MVLGFIDPAVSTTYSRMTHELRVNPSVSGNLVNSRNVVGFSYDKVVDRTGTFFFSPPADDDDIDTDVVTGKYVAQLTVAPSLFYYSDTGLPDSWAPSSLEVQASTFVSRRIVERKASFMEVWNQCGGAWAAAMLIVTAFFVDKAGVGKEGKVAFFRYLPSKMRAGAVQESQNAFANSMLERMKSRGTDILAPPRVRDADVEAPADPSIVWR